MIEYRQGDILLAGAEALVNTVNCVGVMGRGIVLQFKKAFPENFKAHMKACSKNEVQPGKMFIFETGQSINPRYIINFPTKRHWRNKSRIEDIEVGLDALTRIIRQYHISSIAIPPLSSELGGLDWRIIKPHIETAFLPFPDLQVMLYEPKGAPDKVVKNHRTPIMTPGRAALIGLMNRYLNGLLDPFISLLEVHKLMYFMQEAGELLRLKYKKASYGPYAENLRHVLHDIEGRFISGYADGGDQPYKQLQLVPGAVESAVHFLKQHPDTDKRFNRVAELVEGFESSFGLELLSTVHWIMKQETIASVEDVIDCVYHWNDRKRKLFTPRQVELAIKVLSQKGWIKDLGNTQHNESYC